MWNAKSCKRHLRIETLERRLALTLASAPSAAVAVTLLDPLDLPDQQLSVAIESDLNNDGTDDLLTGTDQGLSLFLSSPDQSLVQQDFASAKVRSIELADVNGDQQLDVIVGTDAEVQLYFNVGFSGQRWLGLLAPVTVSTEGGFAHIADVTGDEIVDLVVDRNVRFDVFSGSGDGQFGSPVSYALGVADLRRGFALGDVNQDGAIDVAAYLFGERQLRILLNDGTGIYETVAHTVESEFVNFIELTDLDADGILDLIVPQNEKIQVLTGVGDGSFSENPGQFSVAGPISEIRSADLNDDGSVDLVVRHGGLFHDPILGNIVGGISVLTAAGAGEFAPAVRVSAGSWFAMTIDDIDNRVGGYGFLANARFQVETETLFSLNPVAFAPYPSDRNRTIFVDVNSDGLHDVIAAGTSFREQDAVMLLLADGKGGFLLSDTLTLDFAPSQLIKVESDGQPSFAIAGRMVDSSTVIATVGLEVDGQFGVPVVSSVSFIDPELKATDVNGDGLTDFVGQEDEASLRVWLGAPEGLVEGEQLSFTGGYLSDMVVDIDNNGTLDILIHVSDLLFEDPDAGRVLLYSGNGDGTFSLTTTIATAGPIFAVADLNDDGLLSLVIPLGSVLGVSVLEVVSVIDGSLLTEHHILAPGPVSFFQASDVNGDEKSDIVMGTVDGQLSVVRAGDNGFHPTKTYSIGHRLNELFVEDFDDDGKLDLLGVGYGTAKTPGKRFNTGSPTVDVSLLLGNEDAFAAPTKYGLALSNGNIATVEDVDGDGDLDVLLAGDNGFRVWRNGPVIGDFNGDSQVNLQDITLLCQAMRQPPADVQPFDLNKNGVIDERDLTFIVEDILGTRAGDTNLDGKVDFDDFLRFAANFGTTDATWADGDFNSDGLVDFDDFIMLAMNFGFGA